jgi:uncharacterized membrane protein YeaQ/YmgE (transglycosylase-associated protein family)
LSFIVPSYNAASNSPIRHKAQEAVEMLSALTLILLQGGAVIIEWQHGLLFWIVIGLLAGWLAGKISRGQGYGCITDIILGLIGSVLGGWIFTKLGIFGGGFIYSLAAATVGAVILVSIVHLFVGNRH